MVRDGGRWKGYRYLIKTNFGLPAITYGRVWALWQGSDVTFGQIRTRYYKRGMWSVITTVCPDTWWYNGYPTIAATNREI